MSEDAGGDAGAAAGGEDDGTTVASGGQTGAGGGGGDSASSSGGAGGGQGGGAPACLTSCAERHADGAVIYADLHTCVYCNSCFWACDGAMLQCEQPSGPSTCDSSPDCDACQMCALEGDCSDELANCNDVQDCLDYGNCIAACATQ